MAEIKHPIIGNKKCGKETLTFFQIAIMHIN